MKKLITSKGHQIYQILHHTHPLLSTQVTAPISFPISEEEHEIISGMKDTLRYVEGYYSDIGIGLAAN